MPKPHIQSCNVLNSSFGVLKLIHILSRTAGTISDWFRCISLECIWYDFGSFQYCLRVVVWKPLGLIDAVVNKSSYGRYIITLVIVGINYTILYGFSFDNN